VDDAFFLPRGDGRFTATAWTRGPWDVDAQHGGPPAALLGRAVERCGQGDGKQVARVTFEILRPVPIAPLEVTAEVTRPGRNVELVVASAAADGLEVMRATAWRVRTASIRATAGLDASSPPLPSDGPDAVFFPTGQDVGYHTAMEWRFAAGGFLELGPATAWLRMRIPLVAGEDPTPLQRVLAAADSGNGVSAAVDFRRYVFINTDLSVYLHRYPAGEWVCLDARTTVEEHGVGMTETALYDEAGRIGRGVQALFVRSR
jgi:hypothetical protein